MYGMSDGIVMRFYVMFDLLETPSIVAIIVTVVVVVVVAMVAIITEAHHHHHYIERIATLTITGDVSVPHTMTDVVTVMMTVVITVVLIAITETRIVIIDEGDS